MKYLFYVRTSDSDFNENVYFVDSIKKGNKKIRDDGYEEKDIIGIGIIDVLKGSFDSLPTTID